MRNTLAFRPKLIPTLATLLGLVILLALGSWQLGRYYEKLDIEAQLAEKTALPPAALEHLELSPANLEKLSYRTISIQGTLDLDYAVLFKHRQYQHRPGYWIAAPLVLEDGQHAIWTNLGWLPFDQGPELAAELQKKPTPGPITYTGLLYKLPQNITDTRSRQKFADASSIKGALSQWHSYDIEALLTRTPYEMGETPAVLVLDASHNGDPFPLASNDTITQPYMTAERHQGYFLFWYSTAGALLLLYLGASFGLIGSFGKRPQT